MTTVATLALWAGLNSALGGAAMSTAAESGEGWAVYRLEEVEQERRSQERRYLEFHRVESLSAGLYVLPVDGDDRQTPHGEDEIYCILAGRAAIEMGEAKQPVAAGSVVYVKAGVPHRFVDIEEELKVLVVFAPPLGSSK